MRFSPGGGRVRTRLGVWLVPLAVLLVSAVAAPASAAGPAERPALRAAAPPGTGAAAPHGRSAVWSASLQGAHGTSPDLTVRNIARASVAASSLRVRVGNPYGDRPAAFRSATVGLQLRVGEADLVPGSLRTLTFDGRRQVTVPPGGHVYSDPVPLRVAAQQNLAVSLYAPGAPVNDHAIRPPTPNPPASFLSLGGDHTHDTGDAAYPEEDRGLSTEPGYHPGRLWWVEVVDGRTAAAGTIVALGDSNTAGHAAAGGGDRWTDLLAQRINALPPGRQLAVANAGISGNTVSRQPSPYDPTGQCCGPPAPDRLEHDVLDLAGVRHMILLEGTNDIGGGEFAPPSPASQVIDAMKEIVERAHARGVRVVGATLMPMCNTVGSDKEANRLAVNEFVRTGGLFDGVIDFDAAVRDPAAPTRIRDAYRSDCYHPNAAGHAAMARAVDLSLFGLGGGEGRSGRNAA
ncbi:GDSL-type esterase/lipase family protein [Streptomyces sp. URMC 125]|uniref:GDSL-type esterase/lipase family protein n=1 Tax=Streptomyces sp. URMC 125 TaxID=3423419 RepID=UPI003F1B711C